IQELSFDSCEEIKDTFIKLQSLHNASVEYIMETNRSCLPPFKEIADLGCVYTFDTRTGWILANVECMVLGAQLMVNPPLEPLLQYIIKEGYSNHSQFWIGGKHYDNWRWLNSEIITEGWAEGEPDINTSSACVYFFYYGTGGLLYDQPCDHDKMFICEIPTKVT
ncbi:unnamed protein product, partial [Meganyctiphanes norvegica]